MNLIRSIIGGLALLAAPGVIAQSDGEADITRSWALTEFGEPVHAETMTHWPYVNPDAPRGGQVVLGAFGTFDNLNPYLLQGSVASSIGLTMDTLMMESGDDLLSVYGLIASHVEYPQDLSWAVFHLRPEARYDDGTAITAADFELTFRTIREHGRPFLRAFYREVEDVEVLDAQRIRFSFSTRGKMKPLINVAGLAPMPRHHWAGRDIASTTLEPWPSSGAYRVSNVDAGRAISYTRVEDYWGEDLPVNRGTSNFDQIRYDYYRDLGVMFEAFKAGRIDFRVENSSKRWATEYDFPAATSGAVQRATPADNSPQGIQGLLMNTRRARFADVRVREALGLLFDFEWTRQALLYDQYTRTSSYFPNSDYGASGPPGPAELALLEPFRSELPAAVFERAFEPPVSDGSGRIRQQIREALGLLRAAGWRLDAGKLVNEAGERMHIELLLVQPDFERLMAPYVANLQRVGIDASIRIVDSSQYENRTNAFDFDMLNVRFNFFPPPGPELRSFYASVEADVPGSGNLAGIRSAAVDALIEGAIAAQDLETLKVHTRALDRVLLWGHYLIPEWHNDVFRIAYWDRFGQPERLPHYGIGFPGTWWLDAQRDAAVRSQRP